VAHRSLEEEQFRHEYTPTCQSNDIQRGTAHVVGEVYFHAIDLVLVQLRKPDVSHFNRFLVENGGERPELTRSKRRILWKSG
jgi:hypothetical protein